MSIVFDPLRDKTYQSTRLGRDVADFVNALERECEERGIVACVWAGRDARNLSSGQMQMFSKADLAPLCTSCEARDV